MTTVMIRATVEIKGMVSMSKWKNLKVAASPDPLLRLLNKKAHLEL